MRKHLANNGGFLRSEKRQIQEEFIQSIKRKNRDNRLNNTKGL